ncbi:MAG: hypothetical protein ACREA0_08660 [bacterium]
MRFTSFTASAGFPIWDRRYRFAQNAHLQDNPDSNAHQGVHVLTVGARRTGQLSRPGGREGVS